MPNRTDSNWLDGRLIYLLPSNVMKKLFFDSTIFRLSTNPSVTEQRDSIQPEVHANATRLLSIGIFLLFAISISLGLVYREPWLWMDEVLSYVFVADPSLQHMNDAVVSAMDANPPLYFNLLWFIGHSISLNPLFLREISVVLFAGTIALFFRYTTRLVGNPAVNFVLISAMVYLTYPNFAHGTGIRSYALFMPLCWVYFTIMHRLMTTPNQAQLLLLHTLVGGLMVLCHNYGLFYIAASGVFFVVLWGWSKQRSYAGILASHILIGLLWVVVWFRNFQIQADAGKPHSWIPYPSVHSVFDAIGELMPSLSDRLEHQPGFFWLHIVRVSLIVGFLLFLLIPRLKAGFQPMLADKAFSFLVLSGFIYLATLVISLTVSLVYTSVFIGRYMWPSELLIMFQLVYGFYRVAGIVRLRVAGPRLTNKLRTGNLPKLARWLPLYALLLVSITFYKVWKMHLPFPSKILTYLPQMRADYPVFVERADYFLPIWFHNQRSNVAFLLNWENATRPGNLRNATVDFKVMQSLKEKYGVKGIVNQNLFNAAQFPHFYFVDEANVYQIERYINNGQVKVIRELPIDMPAHRLLECSF